MIIMLDLNSTPNVRCWINKYYYHYLWSNSINAISILLLFFLIWMGLWQIWGQCRLTKSRPDVVCSWTDTCILPSHQLGYMIKTILPHWPCILTFEHKKLYILAQLEAIKEIKESLIIYSLHILLLVCYIIEHMLILHIIVP